ncbi:hypothetical protein [Leucobacter coleopterorum]|uniref:hypothetical protein n=1 Tax=Leucobacter coleopterorum TaxID=2714933 RepID=UPI001FCBEF87|nr:hypothetical protein [Leucobacter coleopterorum]
MGNLLRRGSWAAVIAMLALTPGCAAHDPKPQKPEVLTASKAGGLYLDAVCPVNEAWDSADLELDRLRLALGRGGTNTKEFAAAMKSVSGASATAARQLAPKDQAWPEEVKPHIADVRDTLLADQKQALKVAKLPAKEVAAYEWQGRDDIAASASEARVSLGLPADPELACRQWAEQQKPKKDNKPTKESSD